MSSVRVACHSTECHSSRMSGRLAAPARGPHRAKERRGRDASTCSWRWLWDFLPEFAPLNQLPSPLNEIPFSSSCPASPPPPPLLSLPP
eukprot:811332-Rhodomonas_salina.1